MQLGEIAKFINCMQLVSYRTNWFLSDTDVWRVDKEFRRHKAYDS